MSGAPPELPPEQQTLEERVTHLESEAKRFDVVLDAAQHGRQTAARLRKPLARAGWWN